MKKDNYIQPLHSESGEPLVVGDWVMVDKLKAGTRFIISEIVDDGSLIIMDTGLNAVQSGFNKKEGDEVEVDGSKYKVINLLNERLIRVAHIDLFEEMKVDENTEQIEDPQRIAKSHASSALDKMGAEVIDSYARAGDKHIQESVWDKEFGFIVYYFDQGNHFYLNSIEREDGRDYICRKSDIKQAKVFTHEEEADDMVKRLKYRKDKLYSSFDWEYKQVLLNQRDGKPLKECDYIFIDGRKCLVFTVHKNHKFTVLNMDDFTNKAGDVVSVNGSKCYVHDINEENRKFMTLSYQKNQSPRHKEGQGCLKPDEGSPQFRRGDDPMNDMITVLTCIPPKYQYRGVNYDTMAEAQAAAQGGKKVFDLPLNTRTGEKIRVGETVTVEGALYTVYLISLDGTLTLKKYE